MKNKSSLPFLTSAALAIFLGSTQAQVTTLDTYVVRDVPVDASVNPLTRSISSVFGDGRSVLDTPRAVSTITDALFRERGINGMKEVVIFAPGTYAPSRYGEPSTPNIRGDVAETYLNGQRLNNNLYGYFPSFNGVEAVDVVRGPGSAVYGPSELSGGYVNFVTKQPKFVPGETTVTVRFGTWVPGSVSYANGSVQVDHTATLIPNELAYRISYEVKGGDTFYKKSGVKDDRQDIFAAFTYKPRQNLTLDFNAQYLWQNTPQVLGVDRPSQELIDHDIYYTGTPGGTSAYPGVIVSTGKVKLAPEQVLFSRGDFSNANIVHAQLIATLTVSPTLTLINRTLDEYVNRRRYQAIEYIEYVEQNTFENRTEAHLNFSGDRTQTGIGGFTVRYSEVKAFENYYNEIYQNYDITDGTYSYNHLQRYPDSYYPGRVGPGGWQFFGSADGIPETTHSKLWDPAFFYQHDLQITDRLSVLAGVRGDAFYADVSDPFPAPGTTPWHDRTHALVGSWNTSLTYHPIKSISLYATYNRVGGINGDVVGGGIVLRGSDGKIDDYDFKNRSDLCEVGAKASLLENQLFTGLAAFEQTRMKSKRGGGHDDIRVRGIEWETVYQPTTRFNATANLTWQEGHYVNSSPYELGGRSIYDAYAVGQGPGGHGTGLGSGDQAPSGNYFIPGMSRVYTTASASYRLDNGFGASANATWQGRQHGNLDDQFHLPSQYILNASLFYRQTHWEADIDFLNVTDRVLWTHTGDAYADNSLIFREQPFRMEGYVKFKF